MSRRTALSGLTGGLGMVAADRSLARADAALETTKGPMSGTGQRIDFGVPFGTGGQMGEPSADQVYLERLLRDAIAPPLSDLDHYHPRLAY